MSELDPVDVTPRPTRFTEKPATTEIDELADAQNDRRKTVEREGLPAGYRMRADAHYVDQLTSRSADLPVRWVPIDDIEGGAALDLDDLRPLVQSIGQHGVVQPLLVRRDGGQYKVIGGRKRLTAARLAALSRVPCLVHQVEEAQAEALARADNLRLDLGETPGASVLNPAIATVVGSVSQAVDTIRSAATLLAGHGSPMSRRVALDLVQAEAWRASWQLRSTTILEDMYVWHHKPALIASVLERVREGFAAESRLSGIGLTLNVLDWNASADLDEDGMVCGVTGAVIAAAGLLGDVEAAKVMLVARASAGKALSIDVAQEAAAVSATTAGRFLDPTWSDRPGGWQAAIGIGTARAVAQHHGGDIVYLPRDGRGCTVRLTLGR